MQTPFAVLGIRTAGGAVTGIEYLPRTERAQAPDRRARRARRAPDRALPRRSAFPLHASARAAPARRSASACGRRSPAIPVGESRTYGELARQLHTAPRAVGGACGANPIALVIPCHRVVGSQGSLGGFMNAGATAIPIAIKRWLLAHEGYRFGA